MKVNHSGLRPAGLVLCVGGVLALSACSGGKQASEPAAVPAAAPAAVTPAPAAVTPAPAAGMPKSWNAEDLEGLLAPIALYPDPVLSQVLIAATNPQEVLDAGNWLIQNASLKGKALDDAAAAAGFTPPVRALVQFPATVDMLCMQLAWTTELGEAFVADQAGVLDAVQRLRTQAVSVGNLKSSDQMKVEKVVQEEKQVVVIKPPKPEVVYVPQYDPVAAYAPAPTTAVPVAQGTTTTTTSASRGYDKGDLIATGILAFGAGVIVHEIFDDDDDRRYSYYYPNYGYGGMPYYPPYPYRPVYGSGFYPGNVYQRPPNYNSGFQNNGNIIINTGGARPRSPISVARPNRPELRELNARQPRPRPADQRGPSPTATAANWRGQSTYAGAKPGARPAYAKPGAAAADPRERIANATPAYSKPAAAAKSAAAAKPAAASRPRPPVKAAPKVQGAYAGARPADRPADRAAARPAATAAVTPGMADRVAPRPQPAQRIDRGFSGAPAGGQMSQGISRGGAAERAASARGRQSMPQPRGAAAGRGGAAGRGSR